MTKYIYDVNCDTFHYFLDKNETQHTVVPTLVESQSPAHIVFKHIQIAGGIWKHVEGNAKEK